MSVLDGPRADAGVVGLAAMRAGVPVECAQGSGPDRWLRIGVGQFVPAAAVADPGPVGSCDGGASVAAG